MDYKKIIKQGGVIHLKTDSEFLFGYTLGTVSQLGEILYAHHDIYNNSDAPKAATAIQTFYEQQFLAKNKAITYTQFRL
ncbi:MAG: tRNA (guanosine(46)-N7)-methyltransferase TrmB, partial [Flavobacteriaceae bacterium]